MGNGRKTVVKIANGKVKAWLSNGVSQTIASSSVSKAKVPKGDRPLPALTRASIGHLYFESIYPFEDGNGRIGRALAEKSLAQNIGQRA